ncbi:C6 transcription factor asaR [Fulvia fulva]|nr:C6 transcription factor asaR [Fulvia fulva]
MISLLEAQISELAERLSRVEGHVRSGSTTQSEVSRQSTSSSIRKQSSSGSEVDLSEMSFSPISARPASDRSLSLPFALKFNIRSDDQQYSTPERMTAMRDILVRNIDPLLKIVHLASIQYLFDTKCSEARSTPSDARALKFAICFAAAASQEPSDSNVFSSPSHGSPAKTYAHNFEISLLKAQFMSNPTVTGLQALTIYLICGAQFLDKTYVWSLTAVLVRLAMKLKLHRDPDSQQGLAYRDGEYRRRLWWHICSLDASTADARNTDPMVYERQCSTRFPAAVQDSTINQTVPKGSPETLFATHSPDMFHRLIRFEITYYTRTILFSDTCNEENDFPVLPADGKLSIIDSLEKTLEDKYYRRCHYKSATCRIAITSSKITVAKLKLKIRQASTACQKYFTSAGAEQTITACIEIVEVTQTLRTDPALASWTWLWPRDTDLDAATTSLQTLHQARTRPAITQKAWTAIDAFFANIKSDSDLIRDIQYSRLIALRNKAQKGKCKPSTVSPLGRSEGRARRKSMSIDVSGEEVVRSFSMPCDALGTMSAPTSAKHGTFDSVSSKTSGGTSAAWSAESAGPAWPLPGKRGSMVLDFMI